MAQLGHQVHLWVPGDRPFPFEQMKAQYGLETDFEVSWLPSRRIFKRYDFALSALGKVRNWKPDLIYTWLPQAAWAGMVFDHKPVVLEVHDRASGMLGLSWLKHIMKSGAKKQLAFVSQALREAIEDQTEMNIPADQAVIAPNGVDLKRYESLPNPTEARKQLGLAEKVTVGYTGHFYAGRGVDILFKLAEAYPDNQFLWIGGREKELEGVRHRLAAEQLQNVILTGFVDNVRIPLYQSACEILVMPYERAIAGSSGGNSVDICSPMKMFEYMAAGRAIISSDLPVIHEVLDDTSAVFCPPEDEAAWIKATGELIHNAKQGESKGYNARMKIMNYSIQSRQEKILKFMGDVH